MNIQFQRAVDRFVGIPICLLFSLIHKILGKKNAAASPTCLLVILLSEMGSLVLAQPMFARLRAKYPDAKLHVMLFAKNREVLDLLAVVPPHHVITLDDRSLFGFLSDSLKAILQIRRQKPDVVIDCELFSRVSSLFAYLSGAPLHIGFARHTQEGLYRGSFINRPVLYNPYRHLSLQFLTMVSAITSRSFPLGKDFPVIPPKNPPHVIFETETLACMKRRLYADFPAILGKKLILIYPSGGLLPIRAWPFEAYLSLSLALLKEGYAVGVIGMKEDAPLGQALVKNGQSPLCVDLTGYTKSVRELLAIFHAASLLITNDGGPGQFAALTPLASIVFFGPETPKLYRALSDNAFCFHTKLSCSPCLTAYNHRASPCDGDNQCLQQISPEAVFQKAKEMLARLEQPS